MHGIRFLLRVGFFLSPVMWTYDMFGRRFGDGWLAALVQCNPTIVPITEVRSILLSEPTGIPPLGYQVFVAVSALSFIFGTIVFDTRAHKAVIHA
jgi:ABC-type polysaccharide/polyol phosphate export permease